MKVLAVSGSLREASINSALCRAAARVAPPGLEVTVFAGLGGLPLFNPDLEDALPAAVEAFRVAVGQADALLIASPEYAHGISGPLKNALDWLVGFEGTVGKPIALVNTSPRAGHAYEALREVLETMATCIVAGASCAIPLLGVCTTEEAMVASPDVRAAIRATLDALAVRLPSGGSADERNVPGSSGSTGRERGAARRETIPASPYRPDLAYVHDIGFGHLATGGGRALLGELRRRGLKEGTIVDIGCGGGIAAGVFAESGYAVVGLDLSRAHIEIARRRVPQATFRVGSFVDTDLPRCIAACAIGEVLNYGFDDRNGRAARSVLFGRVFAALAAGGVFLFDVAGPDRAPDRPTRTFFEGDDWALLVETAAEAGGLTRRIVTYRRAGGSYRRDSETHRLRLIPPGDVVSELRAVGFGVEEVGRYGDRPLPPGLHGFIAHKPPGAA